MLAPHAGITGFDRSGLSDFLQEHHPGLNADWSVCSLAGDPSMLVAQQQISFTFIQNSHVGHLIDELDSYRSLKAGWDGEQGAPPNLNSVGDASVFLQFFKFSYEGFCNFDVSLHVDGTVILENDDEPSRSFRFLGDGTFFYIADNDVCGIERLEKDIVERLMDQHSFSKAVNLDQ